MSDCNNCKFAIFQDTGYSNYTVEGTDFYCAKKAHPSDGFDAWYGEHEGFKFGETCPSRSEGEPIQLRVEDDPGRELDGEQLSIYLAWWKEG